MHGGSIPAAAVSTAAIGNLNSLGMSSKEHNLWDALKA